MRRETLDEARRLSPPGDDGANRLNERRVNFFSLNDVLNSATVPWEKNKSDYNGQNWLDERNMIFSATLAWEKNKSDHKPVV